MDLMNYAELLIQYNGFLLIFSAVGFLFSLVWVVLKERGHRKEEAPSRIKNQDLFDEKVFFGEFENLENPALTKDLKPIFDKNSKLSEGDEASHQKFIKMNDMPKFPTLKKEIEDTLEKSEGRKEVQGLLNEIKKDIKKNTK